MTIELAEDVPGDADGDYYSEEAADIAESKARNAGVQGMSPDFTRIEPSDWQLIDPQGRIAATEPSCIKAWARVNGYKPTVENLLGYEQNGWRVQPVPRGVLAGAVCPHGIHMDNACGACVPPRGTTVGVALPSEGRDG